MGNDLNRSIVDAWNCAAVINFLGADLVIGSPFRAGLGGDASIVHGVYGEEDDDDDEDEEWGDKGLEGSSSGTSRWLRPIECDRGELWCVKRGAGGGRYMIASSRPWWWLNKSASEMPSSKLSTSKYSRSIRPTSRLPKTPVQRAQCTFFKVESFKYCTQYKYKIEWIW